MAVIRQQAWWGQQRVDAPHLRAVESGVAGDFDLLAGQVLAGSRPMVVSGFQLVTAGISAATSLQIAVASSVLLHPRASESGTIFSVVSTRANETLSATNSKVSGTFLPSSTHYIGIDLVRTADDSTSDTTWFLDAGTLSESSRSVALARTLDYKIVITTTDFATNANLAPVAIVTTDASVNVTATTDARDMLFRLGTGGSSPNATAVYSFPGGRSDSTSSFIAGDRSIGSLKDAVSAIYTRLWELGGGERWYSITTDRNITLTGLGATFTSSGEFLEWTGTNVHWKGLALVFDNSTGRINEITDQTVDLVGTTDLADGDCVYVDVDRSQNRTVAGANALVAARAGLTSLGAPATPGARYVFAWRRGAQVYYRGKTAPIGSISVPAATTGIIGAVVLSGTPPVPALPVAAALDASNRAMVAGITRAGSTFGAGVLTVGATASDTGITYGHTAMTGGHTFDAAGSTGEAFTTRNNTDSNVVTTTKPFLVRQYHAGVMKDVFKIDGQGGMTLVSLLGAASTPALGEAKIVVTTNGLSTPNTRMQLVIMWPAGKGGPLVIAESDAY